MPVRCDSCLGETANLVLLDMPISLRQNFLFVRVLALSLLGDGCTAQTTPRAETNVATEAGNPGSTQAPSQTLGPGVDEAAVSALLREIAAAGKLADLRWPDFSDYRLHFQRVYDSSNFAPLWVRGESAVAACMGMIQAFKESAGKGLNPEEYDSSRWEARVATLKANGVSAKYGG
jgi:hypothetical protein